MNSRQRWTLALTAVASLMLIAAVAVIAAMATRTAPGLLAHRFTAWDILLGYHLPDPPNAVRLVTVWRFDPLIGLASILASLVYLAGVLRLRRRRDLQVILHVLNARSHTDEGFGQAAVPRRFDLAAEDHTRIIHDQLDVPRASKGAGPLQHRLQVRSQSFRRTTCTASASGSSAR